MTYTSFLLLLPLIILAGMSILVMLMIAFFRQHKLVAWMTIAGIILAGLAIAAAWQFSPGQVSSLLMVDQLGLLYMSILLFASLVVAIISYPYLKKQNNRPEEYYVLLLLASLGGSILAVSSNFASLFLGLEILSVSLYTLVGYAKQREISIEAAIKYLILAAASAAFLLFGAALIYADQGTMTFSSLDLTKQSSLDPHGILLVVGFGMLFVGIGFKLAVVPFHMWIPDVYQGAPAPVSGLIASVSKGAIFAVLLRLSMSTNFQQIYSLTLVLALIAALSMLVGNLLALLQDNVKRILAYSSIAHLGYLLIAFLADSSIAVVAATFYLGAYIVTILSAFGVVSAMSEPERDAEGLADYRGLFWKRPGLAALFTMTLLSLIGIPLTAGFMGKFFVLTAGVGATMWLLAIVLVISSAIGLYYYLRVIVALFLPVKEESTPRSEYLPSWQMGSLTLFVLMLLLLWMGLYPSPFLSLIQSAVNSL